VRKRVICVERARVRRRDVKTVMLGLGSAGEAGR
jgi:hypothetical protein